MSNKSIVCPRCDYEIILTDSFYTTFDKKIQQYTNRIEQHEKDLTLEKLKCKKQEESLSQKFRYQLEYELIKARIRLSKEAEEKAKRDTAIELTHKNKKLLDLEEYIKSIQLKLLASQDKEAKILLRERLLIDKKREMQITIEKKIQEKKSIIHEEAQKKAEESMLLHIKEKDLKIESMSKTIFELQRQAMQGSQEVQGKVQELKLENILVNKFTSDVIESVPKGTCGGDIVQHVKSTLGNNVGKILWEAKRTKYWNNNWIDKLKSDQHAINADVAVIVTSALPKNVNIFGDVNGIWVLEIEAVIPFTIMLRRMLIDLFRIKKASQGQKIKQEILYTYLTGRKFCNRISLIMQIFTSMQKELEKERRVMIKIWEKRKLHIENVINSTIGMHSDLQGIIGEALKEVEELDITSLEYEYKK